MVCPVGLGACVCWVVAAIGERTLSVKSQAKRSRRARRTWKADRFGQAPGIGIRADDRSLTPFGGSAVVGELVRRLELIPVLDRRSSARRRSAGSGRSS